MFFIFKSKLFASLNFSFQNQIAYPARALSLGSKHRVHGKLSAFSNYNNKITL